MRALSLSQRSRPRRRARQIGPILAVIIVAGLIAGCAAASAPSAGGGGGEAVGQPVPAASGGDDFGFDEDPAYGGAEVPGGVPVADLAERKIVRTGEMTLEVPAVAAAVGELRAMALSLDGYVSGSRTGGEDEAATITLRIPADRFDDALERLRDMDGEVRIEATKDEDVTSSVVDLEARIRNLQASEQQYRLLVRRAEKIDDVLAVQSRLDEVRGEIEQLTAQLTQLNGLAAMSTLTVTLVPASTPVEDAAAAWDPGSTFGNAVAALVSAGQGLADAAIWLLIVGLPLLLIVGIVVWLGLRFRPVAGRVGPTVPAADE